MIVDADGHVGRRGDAGALDQVRAGLQHRRGVRGTGEGEDVLPAQVVEEVADVFLERMWQKEIEMVIDIGDDLPADAFGNALLSRWPIIASAAARTEPRSRPSTAPLARSGSQGEGQGRPWAAARPRAICVA